MSRFLYFAILLLLPALSIGLDYKLAETENYRMHQIIFDTSGQNLSILKALDGNIGREDISSIATRANALAAINGSYFEDKGKYNGQASFFLKIQSNIYARKGLFPMAYIRDNKLNIDRIQVTPELSINDATYSFALNMPKAKADIHIFNDAYNSSSLTNPGVLEIMVKNNIVIDINNNGNNKIPENGFVISVQNPELLASVKIGDEANYTLNLPKDIIESSYAIAGSDILLLEGEAIDNTSSQFYKAPLARSAICIMDDNKVGLFVVESGVDIKDKNMKELVKDLAKLGYSQEKILGMNLKELNDVYKKHHSNGKRGLSINDFALALKNLKAKSCLNLDGGSSTSIFYKGKTLFPINQPSSEIADAIIVK